VTPETHAAATQAQQGVDAGGVIMHHILDSHELEIPFTGQVVHLPTLQLMGFDISITRTVVMMWIASIILVVLFVSAARRAREPVPRGLRGLLEILIVFIREEVGHKLLGERTNQYLGYLLTTFFFILACNLLGLVPGMSTATGNISVTAALAGIAFLMIQFAGVREFGLTGHLKNLVPPGLPTWVLPFLIPVEIVSMFAKPFALCVRLFANMTAGHVVIISLVCIIFILKTALMAAVSVPFLLFINLLEILVAFIQAFIFTILTALFISMSAHPAH
jgi:F-type H+-transporting ATPase subunit a